MRRSGSPKVRFTTDDLRLWFVAKLQSNPERVFAVIMESDPTVEKWLKPSKGDFQIHYKYDDEYVPDFAVETKTTR